MVKNRETEQQNPNTGLKNKLSGRKKIFFTIIMISLTLLFFVLFEFLLKIFNYGYDLNLFNKSNLYPGYYEINHKVGYRYFTKFNATDPSNDIFLINKPDTCYRIFVMGCSTARGFPYQTNIMFSRILYYRLQDEFPHKRIEIVNVSMSAVNSYTIADLLNEIIKQKPDAILIYTGHNEYYGALGVGSVENGGNVRWLKILHLKLVRLRTYQLVQNLVIKTGKILGTIGREKGTLMERIAKDKSIEYGSATYYKGIEQFRGNLTEIIEKAKKAGIPVVLSEIVSNIRDQRPFKSMKTKDNPGACELFEKARRLELAGDFSNARKYYYQAKDYDAIRFRAPEAFNDLIIEIGKKYNLAVVPMKSYFENNSPHGLIGDNIMLEHLHPNKNGYFLMADAFFNTLKEKRFISSEWDTSLIKPSEFYKNNWGFTELDSLVADLEIKMIKNGWPFKPETYVNRFRYEYKPKSYEDSVALRCAAFEGVHIEDEHINLAKHYAEMGNNMKAFREYFSLLKSYPFAIDLYFEALDYLYAAGDYQKALGLMLTMPGKDSNYLALFQMSRIYLKLNMPSKAIPVLIRAKNYLNPGENKEQLLTLLYNAYKTSGNEEKEKQILDELKIINPGLNVEKKKSDTGNNENKEIKSLITQAVKYIKQGNSNKALELLNESLKIKETGLANEMIGGIYFQKKDFKALYYFEKAYNINPKDVNTLNNLFLLYLMKKDIQKATKCLNEFQQVSTDYDKIQKLNRLLERATNSVHQK